MHRHRNSHCVSRSLTERGRGAAHEKSARKPGREPETFHDWDELTNFAAAAQQDVRECRCSHNRCNPHLPLLSVAEKKGNLLQILPKIFVDRLPRRWLKVGSSGVK